MEHAKDCMSNKDVVTDRFFANQARRPFYRRIFYPPVFLYLIFINFWDRVKPFCVRFQLIVSFLIEYGEVSPLLARRLQ